MTDKKEYERIYKIGYDNAFIEFKDIIRITQNEYGKLEALNYVMNKIEEKLI